MASLYSILFSLISFLLIQHSYAQSVASPKPFTSISTAISKATTPTPKTVTPVAISTINTPKSPTKTVSSTPSGTPAADFPARANYTIIDIWVPGSRLLAGNCNSTGAPYKRTVAYTVTEHGNAVIDGDVIFGTEADIRAAAVHPSLRKRAFSLTSNSALKWPGGKVLYNYEPGLDNAHIAYFQEGVKQWTDRLPFLKFEYSNSPNARTVVASSGNRSPVGCCGGKIELCPSCNPRSARHEIGHTLGLEHEHQRPDRTSYMTLTCPGGPCAPVVVANTATLPGTGLNWAGSYDLGSLMHYGLSGSIEDGGKLYPFQFTLQPGVVFPGAAQVPSRLDTARVCELYYEDCHSICGDGIVSPGYGEECDDGNNVNGDLCSSNCKNEAPKPPVCVPNCKNQPPNNVCGFRATCETFNPLTSSAHSGETFCMCQAGYRGSGLNFSGDDQYRVEWVNGNGGQTHRVFVKPGQDCGELCSDVNCSEVPLKNTCR